MLGTFFSLFGLVTIIIQHGATQQPGYGHPGPIVAKNRRILEHIVSKKCLTVSQDYRLSLQTCNYELEEPSVGGIFSLVKSNRGGHLMKWATQPIPGPGAIQGCLEVRQAEPKETDDPDDDDESKERPTELILAECDPRDATLNWQFEQIETAKYLLKKFPAGPCVSVTGHKAGSQIRTVPCNGKDPEQAWRLCENLDHKQCDI